MESKVASDSCVLPTNFKEIKALPYPRLTSLCKKYNLNIGHIGRQAIEILLCDSLCISTTGSHDGLLPKHPRVNEHCLDDNELAEFSTFTPTYMQSMTGWTKHLKEIPEVDVGTVKKYLLASQNEEFSKDNMKNYKLSRSYAHLNARSINNIMFNPMEYSNTFCAIKAQCLPSQSTENRRVKWLHVILDKSTGEPYGAFCVCTVG